MYLATLHKAVRLPGLAVVCEMRSDDALEVHPQEPIVIFVHESRRGRAGHDCAALACDVHRRAERLAPRVLEHDVDIVAARKLTDARAQTAPLLLVLRMRVLPELISLSLAVDHQLGPQRATDVCLVLTRH